MDPDPNPTPDQTPFLSNFNFAKKIIFVHIFFLELTRRHIIFGLMRKGKVPEPDLDPGGPKTCRFWGSVPVLDPDPQH
jgi:hypothetical protein